MARKSWNVSKIQIATVFDGVAQHDAGQDVNAASSKLWCSVRLTYTLCAFFSMIVHICMRNTLSFVILCMVPKTIEKSVETVAAALDTTMDSLANVTNLLQEPHLCQAVTEVTEAIDTGKELIESGVLEWTRSQALTLQGVFYYGYIVTLPFAGRLADKCGGKLLFVHSITLQAVCFMLLPVLARQSYMAAVLLLVLQGMIAGCGNPALYQLFVVWAHPTERTALLSFAYGGYSAGALLSSPISSYLCTYGWEIPFYVIGGFSLLFGITCNWLVYNTLDEHPRITPAERAYLQATVPQRQSNTKKIPWKAILTSMPVYAFVLTHFFHTYGIMVLMLMLPRFFKEAMGFSLKEVGLLSSAPFLGSLVSKALSIASCNHIESKPDINLTKFRRYVYAACNIITCTCIGGIILASSAQQTLVVTLTVAMGVTTDLAFSGVYWPSLLYFAPSYAGLLSGIANCLANCCGFLAPIGIALLVTNGTKAEWDFVMLSLIISYALAAIAFCFFSSSKLQPWDKRNELNEMEPASTNESIQNTSFN